MNNNHFALIGESLVNEKLSKMGIKYHWMSGRNNIYGVDFITEYGNIDVKIGKPQYIKYLSKKDGVIYRKAWKFNCHHHGIKQSNVDIFIFVVSEYFENTLYFIVPSVSVSRNFYISERQIRNRTYKYFFNNWKSITYFPKKELLELNNYVISPKYCKYCGKLILERHGRYCNNKCKEKFHLKKCWVDVNCNQCGKKFTISRGAYNRNQKGRYNGNYYCSKDCFYKSQ